MAEDVDIRREQLRAILERAQVEVKAAIERVDNMGPFELAEVRGAAAGLVAFFDKNGSCSPEAFDPVAFFDKNGSCATPDLRRFDPVAFFDKNGSCAGVPNVRPAISRRGGGGT
jgi:hypothetical protein